MKAMWKGEVIAESNDTIVVENNHYFPESSVNKQFLQPSQTHTTCPWKGQASYFSLAVNEAVNKDAVWFYAEPKEAAKQIKNYMAFWKGVEIKK